MRTLLLLLMLCLPVLGAGPAGAATVAPAFETKAKQVYLIEAATGTVLLAKNEDEPVSPASLAKVMTMEVVLDAIRRGEISPETVFPVSENAWRTGGAPSRTATMFAALKSQVRVADLIQGVIVQTANDACIILAEGIDGSEQKFATRMTERARQLGLPTAVFANASGLPDPKNRITMRELVTLAQHLQQTYPEFYPIYLQPEFEWNKIRQRNRNPLLGLNIGVDGLATGFAEGEGYSILASINRDGKRLFLAMGGLATDKERAEEARRLLEWGVSAFENKRVFAGGEVIGAASVYGGAVSTVDLVAKTPIDIFVPVNNPDRLAAKIVYRWPLTAPVEAGKQAGTLRLFAGDRLLREVPLYTAAAVEEGSLRRRAVDAVVELMFFWL